MGETTIVELTTAPSLIEEDDRIVVSAEGRTIPYGHPVRVTLLQRGPGDYHPFKVGDRLSCVVMQGRLMGGVHPVAYYGDVVPPQSLTNREIRAPRGGHLVLAPDRDSAGSEVRLGRESREGAVYQRVMLFDRASSDIRRLRDDLADAMDEIGALMNAAAPTTGGPMIAAAAALRLAVAGGDPSDGVTASLEPLGGGQG